MKKHAANVCQKYPITSMLMLKKCKILLSQGFQMINRFKISQQGDCIHAGQHYQISRRFQTGYREQFQDPEWR